MESWVKKRRFFVLENLVFLASMILLIVLDLKGTGLGRAVAISCVMLGVIVIHSVLRYTYFRNLPSEIRKQRAARRSSG